MAISDLHNAQEGVELVPADVLLITGDLTNTGSYEEIQAFNEYIAKQKHLFQKIIVIAGNLQYKHVSNHNNTQCKYVFIHITRFVEDFHYI